MGRRSIICLSVFWIGVVMFLCSNISNSTIIDPFVTFAKPRLETLLTPPPEKDEEKIQEVIQQAKQVDKILEEEKAFLRKRTIEELDLVSLHTIDPKMAKEKLELKTTDIKKEVRIVINKMAKKYKVDPKLIEAIIIVESKRNYKAVSKEQAGGLMQIVPDTAKKLKIKDRFSPVENIEGGTKYFAFLLKRYDGNVKLALAAYNAGPGTVERAGNVIPQITETQEYVVKVLKEHSKLINLEG